MISPQAPSDLNQIDWTIARCNRLLRPIVHRIATLRRLKNEALRTSTIQSIPFKQTQLKESFRITKPRVRPVFGNSLENKENDPDWISGPGKKKKAGRHYSARSTSNTNIVPQPQRPGAILQPGELSIPTPYLSKVIRHEEPASSGQTKVTSNVDIDQPKPRTVGRPRLDEEKRRVILGERVPKTEDANHCRQNLVKSFMELIDATNLQPPVTVTQSRTTSPPRGARSLLSTCCRMVPVYIAQEEANQRAEDEGNFDISAEVYSLLQDELETREGRGWRHMREVVRAHGVHILRGAIQEGLLPRETSRNIIRHLLKPLRHQTTKASPLEAEILLAELIACETPDKLSDCCPRNQFYSHSFNNAAFATVHVETGSSRAFGFRQFNNLLVSPYVPVEWMATPRVVPLWSNVFKVFRDSPTEVRDAFKLLEATLAQGTGIKATSKLAEQVLLEVPAQYPQQYEGCPRCPRAASGTFLACSTGRQYAASQSQTVAKNQLSAAFTNTIFSLSTILSSFAVSTQLSQTESQHFDPQIILWTLNSLSIDIVLHYCKNAAINTSSVRDQSYHFVRRSIFILASTLVTKVVGCQLRPGCSGADINDLVYCIERLDLAATVGQSSDIGIVNSLPELVCSIAQGASQISKVDSFVSLQHLVRALNVAHIPGVPMAPSTRAFIRRLALSSAVEFSDQHKAPEHLALVQELERTMTRLEISHTTKNPVRSSAQVDVLRRGFRWEEGICEWVAATPVIVNPESGPLFSSPAQLPPATPSRSGTTGEMISETYGTPDAPTQPPFTVEGGNVNLSDLLLASSSPSSRPGPIPIISGNTRANQRRSSSSSSSSSSFGGNEVLNNPRGMRLKFLKRKASESIDVLSDDELVSPAQVRKRATAASKTENRATKRAKRGLLVRIMSSTNSTASLGRSRLSGTIDSDSSESDELSFA
jgi:hypothetical protein